MPLLLVTVVVEYTAVCTAMVLYCMYSDGTAGSTHTAYYTVCAMLQYLQVLVAIVTEACHRQYGTVLY